MSNDGNQVDLTMCLKAVAVLVMMGLMTGRAAMPLTPSGRVPDPGSEVATRVPIAISVKVAWWQRRFFQAGYQFPVKVSVNSRQTVTISRGVPDRPSIADDDGLLMTFRGRHREQPEGVVFDDSDSLVKSFKEGRRLPSERGCRMLSKNRKEGGWVLESEACSQLMIDIENHASSLNLVVSVPRATHAPTGPLGSPYGMISDDAHLGLCHGLMPLLVEFEADAGLSAPDGSARTTVKRFLGPQFSERPEVHFVISIDARSEEIVNVELR